MRYSSYSVCSDWHLMSLICTMWCLLDLLYRVECFVAVIFCSHETLHNRITVVVDMRRSKWDNVKPVLKGLQVHLSTLTKRYSSVLMSPIFLYAIFSHLYQHATICTGVSAVGMHSLSFGCDQWLWALEPLRLHGTPALSDQYHIKLIQSYHKWCHVVRYEWFRKHDMEFCGYYVIFTTSALDFLWDFPVWSECEPRRYYMLPLWCELHCIKCAQNPLFVSLDCPLRLNTIYPQLSLFSVILSHIELRYFHALLGNM